MKKRAFSVKGFFQSFGYALKGLKLLLLTQPNFQVHAVVSVAVIGCGFWLGVGKVKMSILLLAAALVLTAEALNTACEYLTDLLSPQYSETARKVKDIAAAAVIISVCFAVWIGFDILFPALQSHFSAR